MQNGTYPWVASSSLAQKSWPPGYQASLTDLFLKKNPLHFGTGISQLAAASSYIEKMSTISEPAPKCPHPDAKDKPYPCEICQQYLSLCNSLRTDCSSSGGNRPLNSPINTGSPPERKPMNLMPTSISPDRHLPPLHPPPQSQPPVPQPMNSLLTNQPPPPINRPRVIPNKQFICPVCHRFFTQKGNLKTHMMIHTGEKPYTCQICGKSFTQKGNVDTHMKIHTGEKEFGCDSCGKRFTQKGNLKTHIRSVHTKEKPFACGVCGKSFSQKGNMQTHMRTHNKDDRFPCTLCGKTFSQKGNLKTHMQRHTGQLPSKRPYGSRLGINRSSVDMHLGPQPSSSRISYPLHSSPVSSQSSTISPINSPTTPKSFANTSHMSSHIPSPRPGIGNIYSDSLIDCKPPLNCHLPLSRQLSSNQTRPLDNSPSPRHSQLSSPTPSEEMDSPHFLHSKLIQHSRTSNHVSPESLNPTHLHNNSNQNRITSPLPLGSSGHIPSQSSDIRPFYSAPPTPIPAPLTPTSRWLSHSTRHYDNFQPHSSPSSYNAISQHTTPLSRLSLLASGSMSSHHPLGDSSEKASQHLNDSHFHSPGNPDFSQLLD